MYGYTDMNNSVFTQVEYQQFRKFINQVHGHKIRSKGYETLIYDNSKDIQAIVHAASIDEKGNCYPAAYFIRNIKVDFPMKLVA